MLARRPAASLALAVLLGAASLSAHSAPFSFLDLVITAEGVDGTLVLHVVDVAHDLGIDNADQLLEPGQAETVRDRLTQLLAPRIGVRTDRTDGIQWLGMEPAAARHAVLVRFRMSGGKPGALYLAPRMFPYDPVHQTFVNIEDEGALRQQLIFDAESAEQVYYSGSTQGALAVART